MALLAAVLVNIKAKLIHTSRYIIILSGLFYIVTSTISAVFLLIKEAECASKSPAALAFLLAYLAHSLFTGIAKILVVCVLRDELAHDEVILDARMGFLTAINLFSFIFFLLVLIIYERYELASPPCFFGVELSFYLIIGWFGVFILLTLAMQLYILSSYDEEIPEFSILQVLLAIWLINLLVGIGILCYASVSIFSSNNDCERKNTVKDFFVRFFVWLGYVVALLVISSLSCYFIYKLLRNRRRGLTIVTIRRDYSL